MTDVHRCIIVPNAHVPFAKWLMTILGGPSYNGMFVTPLSSNGSLPASHWISAGNISSDVAASLVDPYTLADKSALALEDCVEFLEASDITSDDPWQALSRLNLRLINENQEEEEY